MHNRQVARRAPPPPGPQEGPGHRRSGRASRCSARTSTSTRRSIDDVDGRTLASASTMEKELRPAPTATVDAAKEVGKLVGERAKAAGVDTVVFDRGGFQYHGRVAGVADGAREAGLKL